MNGVLCSRFLTTLTDKHRHTHNSELFARHSHFTNNVFGQAPPASLPTASSLLTLPFVSREATAAIGPCLAARSFSSSATSHVQPSKEPPDARLTHLTSTGAAHMVSIPSPEPPAGSVLTSSDDISTTANHKPATNRVAVARAVVKFSNPTPLELMSSAKLKKGDVLAVARVAGIMGAKRTSDLIPLCHNIPLGGVNVSLELVDGNGNPVATDDDSGFEEHGKEPVGGFGAVVITARVHTFGQTGVEMEALSAATVAGLTVYDMCKGVDRGMRIDAARVLLKEGGRSGTWVEGESTTD